MAQTSWKSRFLAKIDRRGPGDCWPWMAARNRRGYGRFSLNGRIFLAHRVAFELWIGPIPPGLCALHACDNPPCVNPSHLRVGTVAENQADMAFKGRGGKVKGEAHGRAVLTEAQARYAFVMRGLKTQRALANELEVAPVTIWRIQLGRTWKHLAGQTRPKKD